MTIDIYTQFATIVCSGCFGTFAIPDEAHCRLIQNGKLFFCPFCGWRMCYGESEAAKLKKQLEQEFHRRTTAEDDARFQERQRRILERRLRAQRGATTRVKRRVAAGVCPCCKRHFGNLHRHMAGQHPDYAKE